MLYRSFLLQTRNIGGIKNISPRHHPIVALDSRSCPDGIVESNLLESGADAGGSGPGGLSNDSVDRTVSVGLKRLMSTSSFISCYNVKLSKGYLEE